MPTTAIPDRADRLRLVGVVLGGLAIVCVYAYPGYVAYDALDQLLQARTGVLTDWHPPIMSALWGVLDRIVSGPLLMLLLQCGLFLAGTYVLLRRRLSGRRAVVLTLVLFAFPPNLTMMAVILKDSLMTGALLAATAALTSERRWARLVALGLFLFAAALRHNAISIVVPLVALTCPWPARKGPWIRAGAGALIALALTGAAFLVNKALTDVAAHPFQRMLAPMDTIGVLAYAPELTDDEVRALMPGTRFVRPAHLQDHARAVYGVYKLPMAHTQGDDRVYDEPLTPELRHASDVAWWNLVTTYPGAYLGWRWEMFVELIGLTDAKWTPVYEARNEEAMLRNNHQPLADRNIVQRWLAKRMLRLGRGSVIFRPYLYIVLALGLLWILRRDRVVVALLASGFTCLGLAFFVIPGPDIRYCYWLIVVAMLAVAVQLFGARSTPKPAGAAAPARPARAAR